MRLFVAVVPPAAAVSSLDRAVGGVRRNYGDLRWVPPERWHLTLAFLGTVAASALPGLRDRLGETASRSSVLSLAFAGAGHFGNQVFWMGVTGDEHALRWLADETGAAARECGLASEQRPYQPHLTLARARKPLDLGPVVAAMADYAGPVWTATEVVVVRSVLGPPAPVVGSVLGPPAPSYETLLVVPLG